MSAAGLGTLSTGSWAGAPLAAGLTGDVGTGPAALRSPGFDAGEGTGLSLRRLPGIAGGCCPCSVRGEGLPTDNTSSAGCGGGDKIRAAIWPLLAIARPAAGCGPAAGSN